MTENRVIDLGSLTLYDSNAIASADDKVELQNNLTNQLVDNIKYIFSHLIENKKEEIAQLEQLPEEQQIHNFEQSKLYLKLPQSAIVFPRSRKLPEEKQMTKWQKFAKDKGIKKRKKAGMNYDPTSKTMVARWGKRSKTNAEEIPIMEEKQLGRNPFDDQKNEKKLRREKQKLRELKNRSHSSKK